MGSIRLSWAQNGTRFHCITVTFVMTEVAYGERVQIREKTTVCMLNLLMT